LLICLVAILAGVLGVALLPSPLWARRNRRAAIAHSDIAEAVEVPEDGDHPWATLSELPGGPELGFDEGIERVQPEIEAADEAASAQLDQVSGDDEEEEEPDPRTPLPTSVPEAPRRPEEAELGTPTDKPLGDGYAEIMYFRERARGIDWELDNCAPPKMSCDGLNAEERRVVEALYELRVLTSRQIQRGVLPTAGDRRVRRVIARLAANGIVERGGILCARARGRDRRVYTLGKNGFLLLRDDPDHPASGDWSRSVKRGAQHLVHDLSRNEWLFAFSSLAPRQLLGFRGTARGRIKREGASGEKTSSIVPDLTLELRLEGPDGEEFETDLLVEIEWANNRKTVQRKAIAYDRLITGWCWEHPRYKALRRRPKVCFAVPDLAKAHRYIEILDEVLQEHVIIPPHTQTRRENELGIVPTVKRVYVGRRKIFVAVAQDVHQRTLRAWQVPDKPPGEREDSRPIPRRVQLLDPGELVDPATEVGSPLLGG
jgi:hypothetical protein